MLTLLYIVAWLVSIALMIVDLAIVREIVNRMMTSIGLVMASADPESWPLARLTFGWIRGVVDQSLLLILACAGITLTIGVEYYLRRGIPKGLLCKRIIRVFSIELAVGAIGWIVTLLFKWILARVVT